jgi:hypothetical protein
MSFILVLTLFGVDAPDYSYAVAVGLTGAECIAELEKQVPILNQTFQYGDYTLACEVEYIQE